MQFEKDNRRVVIEGVTPEIDAGRFPIKRVPGEEVHVEADIFADGHEAVSAALLYRRTDATEWTEVPMSELVNDRWQGSFTVSEMGRYLYTLQAWIDHFKFWSKSLVKRVEAGQDVSVEMIIGSNLIEIAHGNAKGADAETLGRYANRVKQGGEDGVRAALSNELAGLMYRYGGRDRATTYRELGITVDRERARFSAWYEFFPRSYWEGYMEPNRSHGTFKDAEARLPYVAGMGFDIVYLPPIHPIGKAFRKGKNNTTVAADGDVGSPWAIGGSEGGHKAIHSELGTLEDFRSLIAKAHEYGMEIAMDIAFQVSPDHPYAKEHAEWFRHRPDGTIQYAENPPKKYEDIYPFDFDTKAWNELWTELRGVFNYWIEQGVRVFRVDNPHTKPFHMWEWIIGTIQDEHPDVIFLAEAFTRPKLTYYLAKSGFTQSYTYFAWRNTKQEFIEYMTELTRTQISEIFRPNFWPNTPDILTEGLQTGMRSMFMHRLVLAATLTASYGIYGPAFELGVSEPIAPGKEEYLDSEKYEIKHWNVNSPGSLRPLITRINEIRKAHPALKTNTGLHFVYSSSDYLLAYYKATPDLSDIILTVVNLDPVNTQSGVVELPLQDLGIGEYQTYQVHDLLTDNKYLWSGRQNFVELNPRTLPAHIFRVRRRLASGEDFEAI